MSDEKCPKCGWPKPCPCKSQRYTRKRVEKKLEKAFRKADEIVEKLRQDKES